VPVALPHRGQRDPCPFTASTPGFALTEHRLALGGTLLFIGNARVVSNLIVSGIFDRHPDLKMVSVESGCGWIPFILEALDYEMRENAPDEFTAMKKMPSEYFKTNLYATFWFENNHDKLADLVEAVGEAKICSRRTSPTDVLYRIRLGPSRKAGQAVTEARAKFWARTPGSSTGLIRGLPGVKTIGNWWVSTEREIPVEGAL